MELTTKLLSSFLFGGMTLFSFGFALVLLKQMELKDARKIIRATFPMYYKLVIFISLISAGVAYSVSVNAAIIFASIAVTTIYARQVLMHQINAATDSGNQKRFKQLHTVSVVIQLAQIVGVGYVVSSL